MALLYGLFYNFNGLYLTKNNRIFRCLFIFLSGFSGLKAQTTLLVGSAETYTTIAGAYAACTNGATNYIIEIRSTYTNTESKPITLGANTAASVTIRPQSGVASLTLSTATQSSVFSFTAGDNITIDGRAGGSGAGVLTIENTQATASKYAIKFSGGSTGNTIQYCTVKGSNTDDAASSTAGGVIMFGSGTNSNNTIDHCTIRESGASLPASGINSYDATNNNLLTITNNNFVNINNWSIYANGTKNTGWTISGNSFYQTSSITQNGDVVFIYITDGGNYSITGNYFGGQAANCGTEGTPYTLTGAYAFYGIYFGDSTAGTTNTISGNTFKNISHTTTLGSGIHFRCIDTEGSANFTIGSSGNGNIFGLSSTGTGSITITDNGSSTSDECLMGYINSSGTNNIAYNTMGGVTLNGSNAAAKTIYLAYVNAGTTTFDNNTIGNTTANNITNTTSGILWGIYCAAATSLTISNNTVQNIQHAGTRNFNVFCNFGASLSCTGNTISGMSSSSTSTSHYIICHAVAATATISSNTISDVNFSSSSSMAHLIYVDAGTGAATSTVSSNTIGEYGSSNDITLAGNHTNYAIQFNDGGNATCNSNVIQNVNLSSTGTSNDFSVIYFAAAMDGTITCSDNAIDNVSSASTESAAVNALTGIEYYGGGTITINHNSITDIGMTSTAAVGGYITGIYVDNLVAGSTVNVTKNRVTGLTHKSTLGTSSAQLIGLCCVIQGTLNAYNNVIMIDNGSNTNAMYIYGIYIDEDCTGKFYHNTVKTGGSPSGGTAESAAMYLYDFGGGTYLVKNNIFQNTRSGGSSVHYAFRNRSLPTLTEDYNYLESASASTVGNWSSTAKTFAAWNTSSGATNNKNASITIASNGSVPAGTTSDVKLNGTNLSATVSDDLDGNSRAAAPWRGAFETTTPLPIELLEFTAVPEGKAVKLNWSTLTEINNDYFTIERSANAMDFESIAVVDGAGNSNVLLNYTCTDQQALKGLSYYRLKQTDFDGKYSWSPMVSVNFSENAEISIFPNPTEHSILISFFSASADTYILQFFDAKGSLVKCQNYTAGEDGLHQLNIDLSPFEPGIYFVYLINKNEILNTKVIKQ